MWRYNFKVQIAVVVANMGIHNFLRRAGVINEAFIRVKTNPNAMEVDLLDEQEQVADEINAPKMQQNK